MCSEPPHHFIPIHNRRIDIQQDRPLPFVLEDVQGLLAVSGDMDVEPLFLQQFVEERPDFSVVSTPGTRASTLSGNHVNTGSLITSLEKAPLMGVPGQISAWDAAGDAPDVAFRAGGSEASRLAHLSSSGWQLSSREGRAARKRKAHQSRQQAGKTEWGRTSLWAPLRGRGLAASQQKPCQCWPLATFH